MNRLSNQGFTVELAAKAWFERIFKNHCRVVAKMLLHKHDPDNQKVNNFLNFNTFNCSGKTKLLKLSQGNSQRKIREFYNLIGVATLHCDF